MRVGLGLQVVVIVLLLAVAASPGDAAAATFWTVGSTVRSYEWDSGKTKNLSSWKELTCTTTYGSQYMLKQLTVYREPSTNLDNFIAKMRGTCEERVWPTQTHRNIQTKSATIFADKYRSPAYNTEVSDFTCDNMNVWDTGNLGGGVHLSFDPAKDYVKNVALKYTCLRYRYGAVDSWSYWGFQTINETGYTTGWSQGKDLSCPAKWVMTGIKLRYDTKKGKIRRLKINCRELLYTPF